MLAQISLYPLKCPKIRGVKSFDTLYFLRRHQIYLGERCSLFALKEELRIFGGVSFFDRETNKIRSDLV